MKPFLFLGFFFLVARAFASGELTYSATLQVSFQEETFSCRQDYLGTKPYRVTLTGGVLKGVPKPLYPGQSLSSDQTFPTLQRCFRAALELNDQLTGTHENYAFTVPVRLETFDEDKPGHTHSTMMHRYESRYDLQVAGYRFTSYGTCTAESYLSKRVCLLE